MLGGTAGAHLEPNAEEHPIRLQPAFVDLLALPPRGLARGDGPCSAVRTRLRGLDNHELQLCYRCTSGRLTRFLCLPVWVIA